MTGATRDRGTITRRRAVAGFLAAVLVAALVAVAVLAAGGGGEAPPATGAAALVPADALAYANLSTDRTRPGVRRALALEQRLPQAAAVLAGLRARLDSLLSGRAGAASGAGSWMGGELAAAVLDTASASAGVLIVAAAPSAARVRAALTAQGARALAPYRGRPVWRLASGNQAALAGRFLLVGDAASVSAGLDVAAGAAPSLAAAADYRQATANEPSGRFLDLYASAGGVRRLLESRHDAAGALGVLLDQSALTAVSASFTAGSPGLRVQVHSALDPRLAGLHGGASHGMTPSLQNVVPSRAALLVDSDGLTRVAARALAAAALTGVAGRIGPLLSRLGGALKAEGVNVSSVLSVFAGETAVFVTGPVGQSPSLVVVAKTSDPAAARETLAGLAIPLAQLFQTSSGSSANAGEPPVIVDHQIGDVTVHQLSLTTGLQLYYTVSGDLVIVSTGLAAMQSVLARQHVLAGDTAYQATVSGGSSSVTSLLFLDFSQLLNLGEQTGLTQGARYSGLRADLQGIRAAGLVSRGGEADSNAELLLQIP